MTGLPDRTVLRRAEDALHTLVTTSRESTLYGARLTAARAWTKEAHERLQVLEENGGPKR